MNSMEHICGIMDKAFYKKNNKVSSKPDLLTFFRAKGKEIVQENIQLTSSIPNIILALKIIKACLLDIRYSHNNK